MLDDQRLRLISRLNASQDGIDFLEYLKDLSRDNYEAWKKDPAVTNDVHKGYAQAYDNLIMLFENCDTELRRLAEAEKMIGEHVETGHY